jgi:hypothetical protein
VSYDPTTGLAAAVANGPFTLKANTGYWLVLSRPGRGPVEWDWTASTASSSILGVTMPADHATFVTQSGTARITYCSLADGPQLFEVDGTP